MTDLRILSVRQPFAYLIVNGIKPIENRKKLWSHHGPLLIHAGRKWYDADVEEIEMRYGVTIPRDLPLGGIVGIVGMNGYVTKSDNKFFQGPYGYVMRDATPLPLVPCNGMQGPFKPDADLMERLEQLPGWHEALQRANGGQDQLMKGSTQ